MFDNSALIIVEALRIHYRAKRLESERNTLKTSGGAGPLVSMRSRGAPFNHGRKTASMNRKGEYFCIVLVKVANIRLCS